MANALRFLLLATSILTVDAASARANEQTYINRFGGSWSGSATVVKDGVPLKVSCSLVGTPIRDRLVVDGACTFSIVSIRIGADIVFDPARGRYSGTYIGAEEGPARVLGTRQGNVVVFVITWPRPVHGDTKGRMVIRNDGAGTLGMTTFDNVAPHGPQVMTSDAVLKAAGPRMASDQTE
jgi:hypothetical protein